MRGLGREAGRLHDLGEELLRVAPDLHGGLGADVLCRRTEKNEGERPAASAA